MGACAAEPTVDLDKFECHDCGFTFTLTFPEMAKAQSRALSDMAPSPESLDVFIFVFDGRYLIQSIHVTKDDDSREVEEGVLRFTTSLPQTDNNATLHIVAIDDSDESFVAQVNAAGYGTEGAVMQDLYSTNNKDAYWQKVDLNTPIIVPVNNEYNDLENIVGTELEVKKALESPIPLVRNFAKVSLSKAPTLSDEKFKIISWTIVNERDRGSIAPWYSNLNDSHVLFNKYYDETSGEPYNYDDLLKDGYIGVSVTNAAYKNRLNQIGTYNDAAWTKVPADQSQSTPTTRYLYERKVSSVNPLYILIYAQYNGGSGTPTFGYYKVALGKTDDDTGLFYEYNVLRNIEYNIVINAVSTPGAATPSDAAIKPAFNNISGDVVTKSMLNISDGVDMLYVNATSFVATDYGRDAYFRYRYVTNITKPEQKKTENDKVYYNYVDSEGNQIGIAKGDVVYDWEGPTEVTIDGEKWYEIHIIFNEPTNILQQQSFTIFSSPDPNNPAGTMGLSRTISLVLRRPWMFNRLQVFSGQYNDDTSWPAAGYGDTYVGPEKGAHLTIFFDLPAGLPEAIFPLEFTFEADRQNIENDGIGTAVVQSGPSLFWGVYDHRISYVKTITWQQYTGDDNETSTPASRIQRARFVTTTALSNLNVTETTTEVIVHNPYFSDENGNDNVVIFKRKTN